jgi:hypothetical protein
MFSLMGRTLLPAEKQLLPTVHSCEASLVGTGPVWKTEKNLSPAVNGTPYRPSHSLVDLSTVLKRMSHKCFSVVS